MTLDDPQVVAEVTAAFHAYEAALMADDVPAMDALFHDAPSTVRYGVGEVLYGADAIRAFRQGRGGSPQRRLGRVAITVYGRDFATADAEFFREGCRPARASEPELGALRRRLEGRLGARLAGGEHVMTAQGPALFDHSPLGRGARRCAAVVAAIAMPT